MASPAKHPPIPSQTKTWNRNEAVAGPSRIVESPTQPRFGEIARNERVIKPMVKNRNLPSGFQTSVPPMMSQVADSTERKGKAPDVGKRGSFNTSFDSGTPLASLPVGGAQIPLQASQYDVYDVMRQDDGFTDGLNVDANIPSQEDVEMIDGTQVPQTSAPVDEEIEEVEPHRWIVDVSYRHSLSLIYLTRIVASDYLDAHRAKL